MSTETVIEKALNTISDDVIKIIKTYLTYGRYIIINPIDIVSLENYGNYDGCNLCGIKCIDSSYGIEGYGKNNYDYSPEYNGANCPIKCYDCFKYNYDYYSSPTYDEDIKRHIESRNKNCIECKKNKEKETKIDENYMKLQETEKILKETEQVKNIRKKYSIRLYYSPDYEYFFNLQYCEICEMLTFNFDSSCNMCDGCDDSYIIDSFTINNTIIKGTLLFPHDLLEEMLNKIISGHVTFTLCKLTNTKFTSEGEKYTTFPKLKNIATINKVCL